MIQALIIILGWLSSVSVSLLIVKLFLTTSFLGLKRDYNSLQKSKAEVQQQAEELQRKVSYSRVTIQTMREELEELRRDKHQIEQDLSTAERRNESLCKKIGEFEDRSLNNTNLLNGTGLVSLCAFKNGICLRKSFLEYFY